MTDIRWNTDHPLYDGMTYRPHIEFNLPGERGGIVCRIEKLVFLFCIYRVVVYQPHPRGIAKRAFYIDRLVFTLKGAIRLKDKVFENPVYYGFDYKPNRSG